MKEENKHCYNCAYYRPYYIKEYTRFEKQDRGLCKRKTAVEKHGVCDKWTYNTEFNRRIKSRLTYDAVVKALSGAVKNLTEIGQILSDDDKF